MISQLQVQHFKALRDVTVDLEPFTVLIGPNDSGKSSFLEALYALSESAWRQTAECFWSEWSSTELVYNHNKDGEVFFGALLGQQSPKEYGLLLRFVHNVFCRVVHESLNQEKVTGDNDRYSIISGHSKPASDQLERYLDDILDIRDQLPPPAFVKWNLEDLATPSRLPSERPYPIDPLGYGLATCIAEMKLDEISMYAKLVDSFRAIFPEFRDFRIKRKPAKSIERDKKKRKFIGTEGEGYALSLVREDGVDIPANMAAGGTLITLAFLTLTHLREPKKLLLVEEPENGLHPSRLGEIIEVLRKAVQSQPDAQVVMTTHSPLLLNYVEPQEVRVFLRNKDKDNDVEVYNLADVPDMKDRLKYMMLGELVHNEGEEELIKEIQHAHLDSGRRAD